MMEWVVLNLDAKQAKQHGMPEKMPMPKHEFEATGVKGLTHETALKWVTEFLTVAGPTLKQKEPATAKRYEAYVSKMKFWQDAQKAFTKRDFQKAASLLQLVSNVDKDDYAARQNLATVHAAMGNHDAAIKIFDDIAEVWAGSPEYHVTYANTLLAAGNRDAATEQFVQALEADAECRPAMDGLVTLGLLVKIYEDPLDPKSLTFVRRDALLDYLTSDWDENPKPIDFLLRVGVYHESERRYEIALAASERVLSADSQNEAGILLKASALKHLGKTQEAAAVLTRYVESHQDAASALTQLAALDVEAANESGARAWLDRALGADPGHLAALQLKFLGTLEPPTLEQAAGAISAMEAYVNAHPQQSGPLRLLGRLLLQMNNEEMSLSVLKAAAGLPSSDDDVLAEYLNALLRYGRFQPVLDVVGALPDVSHRDWRLRWSEADAYLGLAKKVEARAAFTAINADEALHVSVRARAKRAVESMSA
jgi:tetratricopeptide (TPR) repeat protein